MKNITKILEEFEVKLNSCSCGKGWDYGQCKNGDGSGQNKAKDDIMNFIRQQIEELLDLILQDEILYDDGMNEVELARLEGENNKIDELQEIINKLKQ